MRLGLIMMLLLLTGCGAQPGGCIELADGSGRTGTYLGVNGFYHVRMHDTGNVQSLSFGTFISVDCSESTQ